MAEDMTVWRKLVIDEIRTLSDEEFQRKAWFGEGQWQSSPDEDFCLFFDNARVPEFLAHADNGLDKLQASRLARLSDMMRHLSDNLPNAIKPEELIDDPRWQAIRDQARVTFKAFSTGA